MGWRAGIGIATVVVAVVVWTSFVHRWDGGSHSVAVADSPDAFAHEPGIIASATEAPALPGGAGPESAPATRARRGPLPGCLTGRVVDRGGIPLSHATVQVVLRSPDDEPDYATAAAFDRTERVDADGRFCVEVPHGGKYLVCVEARGFAQVLRDWTNPGDDLELVADVPARVSGRVVDRRTGEGVRGVTVCLERDGPMLPTGSRECTSNAAGCFALDDLPSGRFTLAATSASFTTRLEQVVLEPGTSVDRTVELDPGVKLSGRVVAVETGSPVAGIRVSDGVRFAITGCDGEFVLVGLLPGIQHLYAAGRGWRHASLEVTVDANRVPGDVVLVVHAAATVEGTVVSWDGRPVERATVSSGCDRHVTGPDGAFAVTVDPRSDFLTAAAPGCTAVTVDSVTHERKPLTIRLDPADVRVAGRVRSPSGSPIAGARVCCRGITGTDAEGRFAFDGCPRESRYEVAAYAPGFSGACIWADRVEGTTDLELVLEPRAPWRARLEGRVLDEEGTGIIGASVTCCVQGREDATVASGAGGAYAVDATRWSEPSGVWVKAEARGFISRGYVRVRHDEQPIPRMDIVLSRPGRVRGRLVDASSGQPVRGATVNLLLQDAGTPGQAWVPVLGSSGPGGEFELDVPAGTHEIRTTASAYLPAAVAGIVVSVGTTTDVGVVQLAPGGAIEGLVTAPADWTRERLMVIRSRPGQWRPDAIMPTDALGWFRMDDVPHGTWDLFAVHQFPLAWGFSHALVNTAYLGSVEVGPRSVARLDASMPEPATLTIAASAEPPSGSMVAKTPPVEVTDASGRGPAVWAVQPDVEIAIELRIEALDGLAFMRTDEDPEFWSAITCGWPSQGLEAEFSMPNLAAGRYRFSLRRKGVGEPVERLVHLTAGEKMRVVLDLPR